MRILCLFEVELSYILLINFINLRKHKIKYCDIYFYSEQDKILHEYYIKIIENFDIVVSFKFCNKNSLVLTSSASKYSAVYISSDLGFRNILKIIFSWCDVYIMDDGHASLHRSNAKNITLVFIRNIASFFTCKKMEYLSIFPRNASSLPGKFNLELNDKFFKKDGVYADKLFFISSASIFDGLDRGLEITFLEELNLWCDNRGYELVILPHRKDIFSSYLDNNLMQKVYDKELSFEAWYAKNKFINCIFLTINSGAIFSVDKIHKRYYVSHLFEPKFPKTKIDKLLMRNNISLSRIHNAFDDRGIVRLIYTAELFKNEF